MSEWIKCSVRMPVCGYVITFRPSAPKGNEIATINYDYIQERFGGQYPVTHWMPLPSPPGSEQ